MDFLEIMYRSSEDRISKLPDDVVSHILSRLPTRDAVRTSVLSKDWQYKWTCINNIQIDDESTHLLNGINDIAFIRIMEGILRLNQNSGIKSFRVTSHRVLNPSNLQAWTTCVLRFGFENFEINAPQWSGSTFAYDLDCCRLLKELKLELGCTLVINRMKNCFPNLKILRLGSRVNLSNDERSSTTLLLNFPVLEELELIRCIWRGVNYVEINAPALTRFVVEGSPMIFCDYAIKIDGAKLENFESRGNFVENVVFTAPSILNAVITNRPGIDRLRSRAYAILKGFPPLVHLELASEIVKVIMEENMDFPLPCFRRVKQLELDDNITDEALVKLLQMMPSLESLFLNVVSLRRKTNSITNFIHCGNVDGNYVGLKSFPAGICSRLKVVKLAGFGGATGQIHLAMSVLKNAQNLEKLIVSICDEPSIPKIKIMCMLPKLPKSSIRASVVFTGKINNIQTWTAEARKHGPWGSSLHIY